MTEEVQTIEDIQTPREENAALRIQLKKLTRQLANQQNTMEWFKKISATRDGLAQKLREEQTKQEKFMNMMLENSSNVIILLDGEGRFAYCTDTFLKMAGIQNFGLINGLRFSEVFEHLDNPAFAEHIKTSIGRAGNESGTILGQEALSLSGSGERRIYTTNTTAMRDESGRVEGIMLLFHDVTETLRAKEAAEAASRAKSGFLATMSHEIRTPLNAIIGLSEIQLQNELSEDTRADLEKIYNSGSILLGIINDILDISKIEAGNFELIPVDYDTPSLINDTVQLNIVRIGSKPITFRLNIDETLPSRLFGDELRVKQVLNNILSNAFKYTKAGMVTLQVRWEKRDNDALMIFTVSDTGQGIKKEDIGRLFSEYSQLDTQANRKIEGTGLGLSITKKLTEMMDGTISVESEYGWGSSFTVCLYHGIADSRPIGKEVVENLSSFRFIETRRTRSKNLVRARMPYGKVLVVDDVVTNLDVARGLMLPYGLTIDCVLSGQEAIEKIRAEEVKYDAVFMDHMMPGMDGVEATRIIRNEIGTEYAKTVPIIALTANALAGNEEMFLGLGFNAFIAKPIDIMRLDVLLNQWVRDKQSGETLWKAEHEPREEPSEKQAAGVLDAARIEGIDLKGGLQRYETEDTYLRILRSYFLHTPELLEKLRSLTRETLPEYAVTVHGLKGASYGVCAGEIGRWAEELEHAAKAGDYEKVSGENAAFIAAAEKTMDDIGNLLRKSDDRGPKKRTAPAPDKALLDKLLDASKRFKPAVMEEVMVEIEGYEYESGAELVTWLREQLDNLEYDAIRERLETPE
ncbi:MAG: response regulator [Spirochaetaceae bacterium]|jgi:PAS domain S-box-containing protein|nr:response regulator [Spirochaetaceae bacterium]